MNVGRKSKSLERSQISVQQACPVLNSRKSVDVLVIISIAEIKFVSILFPHCKLFVILKGADRKLKVEMQKLELSNKEDLVRLTVIIIIN